MKFMNIGKVFILLVVLVSFIFFLLNYGISQENELDRRVKQFLERNKNNWYNWNIPEVDGKVLYDLIIKNNYKDALEIGTSTGRSTIWIAWALSKTGGKLITIEIDEGRHKKALENIKAAGLEKYVDARLADAHELVKELEGPFDFIFSDADKDWYTNYAKILLPKLKVGGCFTAHNVRNNFFGVRKFLEYMRSQPNLKTTINTASRSGISISYKVAE